MIAVAQFLSGLGAASSIFLSGIGAAWASVPAGRYVVHGAFHPILSWAPIVIAGVLALYGLIVALLIVSQISSTMEAARGYRNMCGGLCVGLACLASGIGMERFLERSLVDITMDINQDVETTTQDETTSLVNGTKKMAHPSWRFLMVLVYLEAIGLYGFMVGLLLAW